jgi:hypothetical protein
VATPSSVTVIVVYFDLSKASWLSKAPAAAVVAVVLVDVLVLALVSDVVLSLLPPPQAPSNPLTDRAAIDADKTRRLKFMLICVSSEIFIMLGRMDRKTLPT